MLSDCVLKDPAKTEIFLVQVGPAAPAAKRMRDRLIHAVLPIDASILKIKEARIDQVLGDSQVRRIIAALGVGIHLTRDPNPIEFDISMLRYGKLIIATDATPTGRHIRDQIVSFLYRFNRPVIEHGHLYLSPLDLWSRVNDEDFEAQVMTPSTRCVVPVRPSKSILETLRLLELG